MSQEKMVPSEKRKPIRVWPGVAAASILVLLHFVLPVIVPDALLIGMLGGLVCALAIFVWWLLFSRARWYERLGAIVLIIAALIVTSQLVHISIATGMMGMMFPILALPFMGLLLAIWAAVTRNLPDRLRFGLLVAATVVVCGLFTLVRTSGVTGGSGSVFHWRWALTPEDRLIALTDKETLTAEDSAKTPTAALTIETDSLEWPGFRGLRRDSVIRDVTIEADWSRSPPVELWRRPIGPGWSSFAVHRDRFYTQEQRGEHELVSCYNLLTGQPLWQHRDVARFWESNAGAGPRGTPLLSGGRLFTLGATGILNALDAESGEMIWSRNAAADTGAKTPGWGFSGSPLVVGDVVIVATSGALIAYDADAGEQRWLKESRGGSYSSPHLVTISGIEQVLFMSGHGLASLAPNDGTLLWEYPWPGETIVQPAEISDGDLLISTAGGTGGLGMRRIAVRNESGAGGWKVEDKWESAGLKPFFNDFVVHENHAYGFDGVTLSCIDLKDGKRQWKGGRYGSGQLVLLAEQDVLLVISEKGELALVAASPDAFKELARVGAIEGKTWNHPVLVGSVLLVRNDQEMAAFYLGGKR